MQVLNFPSQYQPGETPYEIFKDRMTAISSIANGIKNIIENKYINKQNSMIAENIQNEIDKQKAIDLSNLIMSPAPEEIYPANLEDTIGQFYDKFAAMGQMRKKETMMGNLPSVAGMSTTTGGVLPAVSGITPSVTPTTTETMIPKTDLYQLYNVIKDLPTGEITWDNIYKKMTEKKPWFIGTTGPEQFVLNQMLGQVTDQKSKLASEINLIKLVQETFYPETVYREPTEFDKKLDILLKTNPTFDEVKKFVGGYIEPDKLSDFDKRFNLFMQTEPSVDELKKFFGGYIETGVKVDIKDILANIPEGFEISSFNMSTTGGTSFSFKPKDTTTAWEFDTWEEAKEFLRTHPQESFIGKIETHGKGFDVNWYEEGTIRVNKIIPTANIIKNFKEDLMNPEYIYDEVYADYNTKYDLSKIENIPTKANRAQKIYDFALNGDVKNYGIQDLEIVDKDGFVIDSIEYAGLYEEYEKSAKEYYEETGYLLPKKYLSLEEAGIYPGFTFGKGYKGGYKSVLNTQNISWSWLNKTTNAKNTALEDILKNYELDFEAMKKDGITLEDIWKKLKEIEER